MRIVHVIDYFHTDVGYQEYYLAREMGIAGHEVRVVTTEHRHHTVAAPGADEARGAQDLSDAGVEIVRLRARQLGHDRAWPHGLAHAIASFRPDAVHCHGPFAPTAVRTALLCRRRGIPLLVDSHLQAPGTPGAATPAGRAAYTLFRMGFGALLKSTTRDWVTNGPLERDFLADNLGMPPGDICLVPLGFDPAVFRFDAARRVALRDARNWADDVVVTVTGKLHPAKRADLVASAAERAPQPSRVRVVVAGETPRDIEAAIVAAAPTLAADGR